MPADGGNTWWPEALGAVGGVFGAGGVGAYLRERRRGRRDANDFALALIDAQAKRLDALTMELGRLQGRVEQLLEENAKLRGHLDQLASPPVAPVNVQVQTAPAAPEPSTA